MADEGFIEEPYESDLLRVTAPLYVEEPGVKPGKASSVALAPCPQCGVPVIEGKTDEGILLSVEPHTSTYAVLWLSKETYPRLKQSRSYPVHRCGA